MVSDWDFCKVGDVAQIQGGYSFKSKDFSDTGIPVIKIKNVRRRDIDLSDVARVSKEVAEKASNLFVKNWDVLISMTGSGPNAPASIVGRIARHSGKDNLFLINQRVGRFIIKDKERLNQRFLYYLFSPEEMQLKLSAIATGSANQVNISGKQIESIDVVLPPLPEQKAIAHILGSLDDKIELNRQMNETLEAMAQALFKSWFVHFDPVIDNALAADNPIPDELLERAEQRQAMQHSDSDNQAVRALFPDELEFTEELGWIPKGWGFEKFSELATLDTTSVKPNSEPEKIWEHFSIPAFDINASPVLDTGDSIKSNKYKVNPNAILISKLNPETERIWWVDIQDSDLAICSTEFMQFIPKNSTHRAFIYSLARSEYFRAEILSRVTGSTGSHQRTQPKSVAVVDILKPDEELVSKFSQIVLSWRSKVSGNIKQNSSLAKLRDTLLPKLLSGELRIPDAAALLEDA